MEKKDYGDKKTELLVKVARMYYEDSMSQDSGKRVALRRLSLCRKKVIFQS